MKGQEYSPGTLVNYTVLTDVFALAIFILGFRPLMLRVGSHVNIWFLGWSVLLLHYCIQLFIPAGGGAGPLQFLAFITLTISALFFILASGTAESQRVGRRFLLLLGAPVASAGLLNAMQVHNHPVWIASILLFLGPGAYVLANRPEPSRTLNIVAGVFSLFCVLMLVFPHRPDKLIVDGGLALLFLTAASLYAESATRFTRGVFAAVFGLAAWGIAYPLAGFLGYLTSSAWVDHMTSYPQYLVIAGSVLSLLEEHVKRTERMAMHDPLTDLPNRRMFEDRLVAILHEARLTRTTVAVLVIDVDNFKNINDTLGHDAGDELLRALARRLSWHMSPRDILARTGGDEFTALLAGVADEHHLRFIASAMMSAASVPIVFKGKSVDVGISVGIALSPDDSDDIETLLQLADSAMYIAKRGGGSKLAFAGDHPSIWQAKPVIAPH